MQEYQLLTTARKINSFIRFSFKTSLKYNAPNKAMASSNSEQTSFYLTGYIVNYYSLYLQNSLVSRIVQYLWHSIQYSFVYKSLTGSSLYLKTQV